MKTLFLSIALVALAASPALPQQVQQSREHSFLKVGDKAPDFSLDGTNNFKFKLSDYAGKKNVVLAFFPAAFTAGCTTELTAYTKEHGKFDDTNTVVVAISTDFIATLNHWSKEMDANFPFLSDHARQITKMYGVLNEPAGIANRTSFVVDTTGKIVDITEDRQAIDISGALAACSRLKK
ncbi:MAG TPA: redoxin domain-containing protein [Bryobacteraceae bacterium]|nr:redoxin domain-containing protein [Bryobacteraceae bacterium]